VNDRSFSRRRIGQLAVATGVTLAARTASEGAAQESGATWQQVTPPDPIPKPRWDHSLAAHDAGKKLVLFGGRNSEGVGLGDTWVYSRTKNVWTSIDARAPSPRFGHAIATRTDDSGFFLFGGQSDDRFFNDVWFYDFNSDRWTRVHEGSKRGPSPRYGTSLVATGKAALILSHGFTDDGRFDDTWRFDIDDELWEELTPPKEADRPLKRRLHEAVWSEQSNRMLLFGGCSSGSGPCPQGDLWAFNPSRSRWKEITTDTSPGARSNPGLVYDRPRNRALIFGGLTDNGYDNTLWSLSDTEGENRTWSEFTVSIDVPPARASHDAVITGPHLYIFGGTGGIGAFNDLWTMDVGALGSS
jgi:N-acetylneuraminic acid mutarotase